MWQARWLMGGFWNREHTVRLVVEAAVSVASRLLDVSDCLHLPLPRVPSMVCGEGKS